MANVPLYITIVFVSTTILTFYLFIKATKLSIWTILGFVLWLGFQAYLAYSGFYLSISLEPSRFLLAAPPALLLILAVFISPKGRGWILTLSLKDLTLIHIIRIPVELVLFWFFVQKMLPELMTFSGRNFDILAGITAPVIYYFTFVRNVIAPKGLLFWNIVCLILLLNIIGNAILSTPIPIQQFALNQPNIAILYFPLVWLPTFVVPIVLFSHFAAIYKLVNKKSR